MNIGTIFGGIHNSIIAGRDVIIRILTITINIFTSGTDERRTQRNRRRKMLELVKNFWVKGVLEQSLHCAAMIALGLKERAGAIERPWDMVLQASDQPRHTLLPGTKIVDVFDEMNRALLILGEPGSGKTTMLLELARDTIARAEGDPTQPIPVVFNLSSWAEKRHPFAVWLVEELNAKYHIPKRIARPWVENDDLLLLLDGVDEVKREHRDACVEAINAFRQEHGLTPLVVCSRVEEYEALTTRLKLQGAVLLQPLTPEQVDEYLERAGTELVPVHEMLREDATLQELVETPLMLSIMSLAFRGLSAEDLQALGTVEARRRHVFDTYVRRMLEWRGASQPYPPQQTVRWLAWLAERMSQHAQTMFLIDRMQPSWVQARACRWVYALLSRLIGGLAVGLGARPVGSLVHGFTSLLGGGLTCWLSAMLSAGLTVGLIDALRFERMARKAGTRWHSVVNVLVVGLVTGLAVSLVVGLVAVLVTNADYELWVVRGLASNTGLSFGLVFGVVFGLRGSSQTLTSDIHTTEGLGWSWDRALAGSVWGLLVEALLFVTFGAVFLAGPVVRSLYASVSPIDLIPALGEVLINSVVTWVRIVLSYEPMGVLANAVFGLLIGAMLGGLGFRTIAVETSPNQGIRSSARTAVCAGLVAGLAFGLAAGHVAGVPGFPSRPVAALAGGLLVALWFGGLDVIQHYTLRLLLYSNGCIPWNYARFLDYAAERIFLRKVGGGYIFVHRLLMEHLATMSLEEAA